LIFILYEICRNEDVERKVFEELKAALITPDTFIYDADVTKLPYLKACITEAMRLSPVAPNLARVTNASTEIQGYKIPPYVKHFECLTMSEQVVFTDIDFHADCRNWPSAVRRSLITGYVLQTKRISPRKVAW